MVSATSTVNSSAPIEYNPWPFVQPLKTTRAGDCSQLMDASTDSPVVASTSATTRSQALCARSRMAAAACSSSSGLPTAPWELKTSCNHACQSGASFTSEECTNHTPSIQARSGDSGTEPSSTDGRGESSAHINENLFQCPPKGTHP